ncbi:hypothetical protein CPT_Slocum_021 [Serratia phage Slocum]|nr:hypothetical protein CPT_Slocum_021 [Serratia phage Slocum]
MTEARLLANGDIELGQYCLSPHALQRFVERTGQPLEEIFDAIQDAHVDWDYPVKGEADHYAIRSGQMVFICKCVGAMHHIKTAVIAKAKKRRKKA